MGLVFGFERWELRPMRWANSQGGTKPSANSRLERCQETFGSMFTFLVLLVPGTQYLLSTLDNTAPAPNNASAAEPLRSRSYKSIQSQKWFQFWNVRKEVENSRIGIARLNTTEQATQTLLTTMPQRERERSGARVGTGGGRMLHCHRVSHCHAHRHSDTTLIVIFPQNHRCVSLTHYTSWLTNKAKDFALCFSKASDLPVFQTAHHPACYCCKLVVGDV